MDASGNWVALGDIRSDRDLVSGEQVQVMLVDKTAEIRLKKSGSPHSRTSKVSTAGPSFLPIT
ncbi:hypothetical protein [Pseudomonas viridiflava]|uniref:hypothetical protein n=1 Tax=Pseudomonas viridiflava TaxID=33069 RepID=UPI000F02F560|nr:hypothetical protein [Pseudomonas viridiflava]